ncbi:DNA mismatch repair protein MutL [Actinoplanes sichuanensis]|uniref:DNA mismatch repair protein MutL n=1 Tax=Actinoplanes sichuanensis TaxID=512349 RepID=A0ABW4ALS2_9ACTN|nr:DNA mismatch repair protein MutL [Actinoplanes sichuanensis]
MRSSRWVPIAGWCVATATSIVLSSVALSPVLNAARADSGELPDIDQLPAPAAVSETGAAPPPETADPTRTTRPTPSRSRPSSADPKPTSKSPSAPGSSPATTTTAPATSTENGWTVTTSDGVKTYVKSFTTEGGVAVIRMTSKGIVSLVTATPADGYRVEKQGSDVNLAVYFIRTEKGFIVHAQWWNNEPFVEVSEVGS